MYHLLSLANHRYLLLYYPIFEILLHVKFEQDFSSESNGGTRAFSIYLADICTFLYLTLGIRFKEMALYSSMQMVRSNENNNIIYSNSMKTNRNELMKRLLPGLTDSELENLVRVREEARRPIPASRKMGVKQFICYFENNNLYKPPRPIPAPPKSSPMKINYWDEIYPDDKIYIRPEDGKKCSIVDGIYYAVHPIYILLTWVAY